jgi:hypothetical protein
MWGFFSKDPSKDLVNFDIQEQVQIDFELQEKTIWSLNNAKKKGSIAAAAGPTPNTPAESLFTVFSCQAKQGNENWVSLFFERLIECYTCLYYSIFANIC